MTIDSSGIITDNSEKADLGQNSSEEETVEIVGACKLMDGFFLGDAICAEVRSLI